MPLNYRETVRNTLRTILSDSTSGINAASADTGLTVDWTGRGNFLMAYLDPEAAEIEKLIELPGAVLYTSEAVNDHGIKGHKFSGQVIAHLDIYLRYRPVKRPETEYELADPWESKDMETVSDDMETAVVSALHAGAATFASSGVRMVGFRTVRDPVQLYGDGYGQRVAITIQCNLEAN